MVQQLKEKFDSTTARSERLGILTVLPKKIMEVFGVNKYMAQQASSRLQIQNVGICYPKIPKTLWRAFRQVMMLAEQCQGRM